VSLGILAVCTAVAYVAAVWWFMIKPVRFVKMSDRGRLKKSSKQCGQCLHRCIIDNPKLEPKVCTGCKHRCNERGEYR
jgi:hypothetical protein